MAETEGVVSLGERPHDPDGCHWGGRPHLGPCRDRGTEAGRALTEIRTVLSRAQTALDTLHEWASDGPRDPLEQPRGPKPEARPGTVNAGPPPILRGEPAFDDPDLMQMRAALRAVIALLEPWQRTGRTTHWVADTGPAQLLAVVEVPGDR